MTLKAVFFDFDGVLTLNARGSSVTIDAIHRAHPGLTRQTIGDCYYRFHPQLLRGPRDHRDVWDDFCACVGKEIAPSVLDRAFLNTPINPEVLKLAAGLAGAYQLGIITANAVDRMQPLIEAHGLDSLFDPIVISAEVGALKDDARIFEHALRRTGRRAEECVFIDNQARNLVVPGEMGFKTVLFDPEQNDVPGLARQLAEWGVPAARDRVGAASRRTATCHLEPGAL